MTYTVTVYESGHSQVITIPKGVLVSPGDSFSLQASKNKIVLTKKRTHKKTVDLSREKAWKDLEKLAGSISGLSQGMNPGELDDFFDTMYEK